MVKERKTIICYPVVDTFLASRSGGHVGLRRGQTLLAGTVPMTHITIIEGHLKTGPRKCQNVSASNVFQCLGWVLEAE